MIRWALVLVAWLTAWLGAVSISAAAAGQAGPANRWSAVAVVAANGALRPAALKAESDRPPIPPLPRRKSAAGAPEVVAETWTGQEIAAAKARCAKLLKKIDAVIVPHPPIKEGKCGAAAPIRLVSLGKRPQVSFEPPALVNCTMAEALHTWIERDLQPLAKKYLGERIAKVEVMSDYSCRASTGRVGHRLSEHAYVDALDIGGFVTESGKTARVLDAWGTTNRDLVAQVATAKAAAEAEAAQRTAADKAAQRNLQDSKSKPSVSPPPAAVASKLGTPGSGLARRTRADGVERITLTLPGTAPRKLDFAARLGGPSSAADEDRPAKVAALGPQSLAAPAPGPSSRFLRAAHAAACRLFGTTLGPEANEAHRNHFHVDMAERKYKKICD